MIEQVSEARRRKQEYDRVRYRIVRVGVPLLNLRVPRWRSRTSEAILDLESHAVCVVGQLFPSYWEGLRELSGLSRNLEVFRWSVRHGFDVWEDESYATLDRAWRNELSRS